jgi:AcrR family transcriptional regulator
MLEAASQLIERDGLEALNTNRIAELAGVSIGTLYQYFRDKDALVAALTERELGAVTARTLEALSGAPPKAPGGRVRQIVHSVFTAFGGRSRVQRQLLARALAQGRSPPAAMAQVVAAARLSSSGVKVYDGRLQQLTETDAFVLTQAFAGVVRASLLLPPNVHSRQAIEDALVRLVMGFFASESATRSSQ